jgi:uncharacterized protein (TIGR03435 family)
VRYPAGGGRPDESVFLRSHTDALVGDVRSGRRTVDRTASLQFQLRLPRQLSTGVNLNAMRRLIRCGISSLNGRMRLLLPAMTTCLTLSSLPAVAQPRIALDVVSVRESPASSADEPPAIRFTPGRLQIVNMSMEGLVANAYGVMSPPVRNELIVGWPQGDVRSRRFDVTATLSGGGDSVTQANQRRLILELLATRFGLRTHTEKRPMRVYALTQVKKEVLGPKLRRVEFDCFGLSPAESPKDTDGRSWCRQGMEFIESRGGWVLRGSGGIEQLATTLQTTLKTVVVDATDLRGNFTWDVELGVDTSTPFTSLRDQLGLNLQQTQASVDVVVIDSVSMPTAN